MLRERWVARARHLAPPEAHLLKETNETHKRGAVLIPSCDALRHASSQWWKSESARTSAYDIRVRCLLRGERSLRRSRHRAFETGRRRRRRRTGDNAHRCCPRFRVRASPVHHKKTHATRSPSARRHVRDHPDRRHAPHAWRRPPTDTPRQRRHASEPSADRSGGMPTSSLSPSFALFSSLASSLDRRSEIRLAISEPNLRPKPVMIARTRIPMDLRGVVDCRTGSVTRRDSPILSSNRPRLRLSCLKPGRDHQTRAPSCPTQRMRHDAAQDSRTAGRACASAPVSWWIHRLSPRLRAPPATTMSAARPAPRRNWAT